MSKVMSIPIGWSQVGEGAPVFILAEVASAHQGDANQAMNLARAAKEAGAGGVKFQLFRASELVAPNDPRTETFRKIELPVSAWERLLDEAADLGLPILADVFDRPSLSLGEARGISAYKIHSTDMENPEFIREVAATGKPVLLSTGGCQPGDVEAAIDVARRESNEKIILLHGIQNFPTRVEDSHLRFIHALKAKFGLPVGFLDHVDGGSPMAHLLPALALAFGADLIEKHITLNRDAKGFDYESSLGPVQFREMVDLIRESEIAFGKACLPRQKGAESYHRMMRRAVMSRVSIREGEPLRAEQLAFLRNERGLAPKDVAKLVGRKPRRDLPAWHPLTEELFE